ncbi:DNA phosphorothioation-dependent restriction protein DptG [Bacillus litorisediminis]|uniref:DNA phosphorothioation-dependent restriction protein DptG n=1 Tax=Bacillus litorisediminis TaxID=2922713 RepID=UPI001FB0066B|nr:DNA phosphorothioation-dependent restriction protein DptG [Bacillus litorisediminis]
MSGLEALRKSLNVKVKNGNKTLKHTIHKRAALLPFKTRNPDRAKFGNGFAPVLGEFYRKIENQRLNLNLMEVEFVKEVSKRVQMNEEDRPYFESILKSFLFSDNQINLFHPMMFKYIPLSKGKEADGEKDIAHYIYEALLDRKSEYLKPSLEVGENQHVLVGLVHKFLPKLEETAIQQTYRQTFPFIRDVFFEDLQTLVSNRDFFMNNISLFLAYYYFFSITQLTLKLNQYEELDEATPNPIYYNLDWEASNRNRKANSNGFKLITEAAKQLLVHINTIEHVNFIMDTDNLHYKELLGVFNSIPSDEQERILSDIYTWTIEYSEIVLNTTEGIEKKHTLEDAYRQLQKQLFRGVSRETTSRYALSINEIGKLYFLKTRGSLGYTLNVTQDFLLLLTALSVKHEKISLKQLFIEFEKRGVFFDRYSREEVVKLFNKLNLIEKKSDSGDAQYVKPIL